MLAARVELKKRLQKRSSARLIREKHVQFSKKVTLPWQIHTLFTHHSPPTQRKNCSNPAREAISVRAMRSSPAPPMLMMDRITAISMDGGEFGKGHVVGKLDITPDLWFFGCHFIGDPVMPG